MNRKSVPTNGNHFLAVAWSMFPRVMLSRISANSTSTAVCTRFGRACMRRAMNTIVQTVRIAAIRMYITALLKSIGPMLNHVSSLNSFCGWNSLFCERCQLVATKTTRATSMKRRNVISAPSEVPEADDHSRGSPGEPEEQAEREQRTEGTHECAEHAAGEPAEHNAAQKQRPRHDPARGRLVRPRRRLAGIAWLHRARMDRSWHAHHGPPQTRRPAQRAGLSGAFRGWTHPGGGSRSIVDFRSL